MAASKVPEIASKVPESASKVLLVHPKYTGGCIQSTRACVTVIASKVHALDGKSPRCLLQPGTWQHTWREVAAMSDDNANGGLIVPSDEPWMSHAFVSKLATQVSLPYRRPKDGVSRISRRNGNLSVTFSVANENGVLPYGKYPRLFELWATTMVKTDDECWNPETNVINLGSTFREFLKLIKVQIGGRQLQVIKPQLENLFSCVYSISNSDDTHSRGVNFVVAENFQIDWLRNEPQERSLFENWVQLSQGYVEKLRDSPVPVDLDVIAKLNKPMALDVYWWLARRYSYLRSRQSITWQQLYRQFGSGAAMRSFKQHFKRAVAEVVAAYPEAKITCGKDYVTLYPSATSVPTTAQVRHAERLAAKPQSGHDDGHWFEVAYSGGHGQVYGSLEDFSTVQAQAHLAGDGPVDACPVCRYDERNQPLHGA